MTQNSEKKWNEEEKIYLCVFDEKSGQKLLFKTMNVESTGTN